MYSIIFTDFKPFVIHVFVFLRVFMLLTALGQKSLSGAAASSVIESLLTMLAKHLHPLMSSNTSASSQRFITGIHFIVPL